MKRREFIATGTGALAGMVLAPATARAADATEEGAIRQTVQEVYQAFSVRQDKAAYRAMLADDYLLLENGEVLDIAGDLALMPSPDDGYQRKDAFEFKTAMVQGDLAWVVYLLRSDITDKKRGFRHSDYLESMILRRTGGRWLVALLHSTKIIPPAK